MQEYANQSWIYMERLQLQISYMQSCLIRTLSRVRLINKHEIGVMQKKHTHNEWKFKSPLPENVQYTEHNQ